MTWVDIVVVAVIGLSALMASMRGLVREVLGIGSWAAAGAVALWSFPHVQDRFRRMIPEPDIADVAAFGVLFLASLLLLSLISGFVGKVVRTSLLGGLDRTLGTVFGIVRGVGVLAVAYILVGMVVPFEHWPEAVKDARSLPYIYETAAFAVRLIPEAHRPPVYQPAGARQATAADLLRVRPQGKAIGQP